MLQKEQTLVSDLSYENGHFISIPSHKLFPLIIMQGDIIVFPPYNQIDNTLICHDYCHGKKTATVVMLLHLETVCFFYFFLGLMCPGNLSQQSLDCNLKQIFGRSGRSLTGNCSPHALPNTRHSLSVATDKRHGKQLISHSITHNNFHPAIHESRSSLTHKATGWPH